MTVKEIVKDTETKMKRALESVQREFREVRTGRAHPGLIEGMHIDYYGTPTMIKQIASISIPDPKTIIIQLWDVSAIPEVEKAISNSKLGVVPNNDGKIVRLNIPPLSEERRAELSKVVKDMAEHGRVSLRTIRRDANERIKKSLSDKVISEDENFKAQDEVQKLTDRHIQEIERVLSDKQSELVEIHK